MGNSGKLFTKNDELIDKLLKDPLYKVTKKGVIYTKITPNGQGVQEEWREAGHAKKDDGYIRFRYKGEYLFSHRVVFRKFNGPLQKDMTIRHLNNNPKDNKPKNLALGPHKDNNADKWKKYYNDKKSFLKRVTSKLKSSL